MDHRRFGIAALAPRMATVGMKIQASRSPLSERPKVRFRAVHAARFHRASLSLETDLVRSTEGARHSPSGLDGNREATTGRGNIARPILREGGRRAGDGSFPPLQRAVKRLGRCDPGDGPRNPFTRGLGWRHVEGVYRESIYLVDPASSHMLVSKIKPCKCQHMPPFG